MVWNARASALPLNGVEANDPNAASPFALQGEDFAWRRLRWTGRLLTPVFLGASLVLQAGATPPMPHVPAAEARQRNLPCAALKSTEREPAHDGVPALFAVRVKMNVDVDGAPTAYGPRGTHPLDSDKDAHGPAGTPEAAQVVGYMTEYDGGPPTVQGKDDPAPGYYVSQTSWADLSNKRMEDPRRYLDATRINYVVLGKAARRAGVQVGDFATVYSCRTGRSVFAIVGDDGNESGAEGSLALVQALGYPIKSGMDDSVDEKEIVIRYAAHSNPRKLFFFDQKTLDAAAKAAGLRL
jgi:hypothetical protein